MILPAFPPELPAHPPPSRSGFPDTLRMHGRSHPCPLVLLPAAFSLRSLPPMHRARTAQSGTASVRKSAISSAKPRLFFLRYCQESSVPFSSPAQRALPQGSFRSPPAMGTDFRRSPRKYGRPDAENLRYQYLKYRRMDAATRALSVSAS